MSEIMSVFWIACLYFVFNFKSSVEIRCYICESCHWSNDQSGDCDYSCESLAISDGFFTKRCGSSRVVSLVCSNRRNCSCSTNYCNGLEKVIKRLGFTTAGKRWTAQHTTPTGLKSFLTSHSKSRKNTFWSTYRTPTNVVRIEDSTSDIRTVHSSLRITEVKHSVSTKPSSHSLPGGKTTKKATISQDFASTGKRNKGHASTSGTISDISADYEGSSADFSSEINYYDLTTLLSTDATSNVSHEYSGETIIRKEPSRADPQSDSSFQLRTTKLYEIPSPNSLDLSRHFGTSEGDASAGQSFTSWSADETALLTRKTSDETTAEYVNYFSAPVKLFYNTKTTKSTSLSTNYKPHLFPSLSPKKPQIISTNLSGTMAVGRNDRQTGEFSNSTSSKAQVLRTTGQTDGPYNISTNTLVYHLKPGSQISDGSETNSMMGPEMEQEKETGKEFEVVHGLMVIGSISLAVVVAAALIVVFMKIFQKKKTYTIN